MCVLVFSKIFRSNENSARYYHKYTKILCEVPIMLVGFYLKLNFYLQIFEEYSNIKFH